MEGYLSFMADLDYHVNTVAVRQIRHRPVPGVQRLGCAPGTLFKVMVVAGNGDDDRVDFL